MSQEHRIKGIWITPLSSQRCSFTFCFPSFLSFISSFCLSSLSILPLFHPTPSPFWHLHSVATSLPPLYPLSWKEWFLLLLCFFFAGTDFHGLFEEPCSVLAWRLRNLQVLIQLSVPVLGLHGEPEVGLDPIKTLLLSQHIRGDPTDEEWVSTGREMRKKKSMFFGDLWHNWKRTTSSMSMIHLFLTFLCVISIKWHYYTGCNLQYRWDNNHNEVGHKFTVQWT